MDRLTELNMKRFEHGILSLTENELMEFLNLCMESEYERGYKAGLDDGVEVGWDQRGDVIA